MNPVSDNTTTLIAGVLLIAVPIAFNAAFAALAAKFDYPNILRKPTADVLERFHAGGSGLILLWWGFTMTAALLTPLAILVSLSLDGAAPAILFAGAAVGVIASAVQFLGLVRWPFLVPYLARESAHPDTTPARREAIDVVFQSFNRYLGVAVGEHLGFLFTGAWTALISVGILQSSNVHGSVGATGILIGTALALCSFEFVGPFETKGWKLAAAATPVVYIVWSLWLMVAGIALLL
jgi:hypothetical protein